MGLESHPMSSITEFTAEDTLSFEDDSLMEIPPINEDFEEKVQEAQEQLLKLRHEQEQLEKQKTELENLSRQQEKFVSGRTVLVEQLNRSISTLEREAFEAEKRVELFLHAKDSFGRHLELIESFNPEQWSREELRTELCRALSAIDDAETEYDTTMSRLSGFIQTKQGASLASELSSSGSASLTGPVGLPRDFTSSFLSGLAFTLPFMIFSLIALLLYLVFHV